MKYQNLNMAQKLVVRTTFIGFMVRDRGWTADDAHAELDFLLINGQQATREYYTVFLRRTGANVRLNRVSRNDVYDIFETAIAHTVFKDV